MDFLDSRMMPSCRCRSASLLVSIMLRSAIATSLSEVPMRLASCIFGTLSSTMAVVPSLTRLSMVMLSPITTSSSRPSTPKPRPRRVPILRLAMFIRFSLC